MPSNPTIRSPWSLTAEEVARNLEANLRDGLSSIEAGQRRLQFGPNRLEEGRTRGPLRMLLSQFADLMIALLLAAAVVSVWIGDVTDSILIAGIVVANAGIGFAQEWRAEKAIAALRRLSQPTARARRDGQELTLAVDELVPGDLIDLASGDLVQADARLVDVADLQIEEAPLTGESLPVDKASQPIAAETVLAERTSMVYAGTSVTRGRARALVTATGMATELGKVASLLAETASARTPLQRRLARLSKRLAVIVLGVCLLVFALGIIREPVSEWDRTLFNRMLLVSVSLAVAAIPEGLPAVITVALALGSQKMAARNAVVRRLSAVETLGSVNVICSDKTGTLTQNRMVVSDVLPARHEPQAAKFLLQAGVLCNDASLSESGKPHGSPTEVAILRAAVEGDVDPEVLRRNWPRLSEIPFDSTRKRMITLHRAPDGRFWVFAKGATEGILHCSNRLGQDAAELNDEGKAEWREKSDALAHRGRRVLAAAARPCSHDTISEDGGSDYQLLGLFGIVDPVRPEARESIARCRSAGIRLIMVTGDHPGTAQAIAEELDVWRTGDEIVNASDLDRMSQAELEKHVSRATIFARVSPEHKLRIVRALQAHGWVVAMTGDGVNDAPALKQADIGVAMGQTGTDVAKQAGEMILADDNFSTIVAAVEEGRVVYDNIRKFVRYLLTANAAEILVFVSAMLLGYPLPLLPVHILWINLVTDGLPALALGYEPAESDVMRRHPRPRDESLFADGVARSIALIGLLMAAVCVAMYVIYYPGHAGKNGLCDTPACAYARTIVFLVLAVSQLFYVLSLRSAQQSFFALGLWSNFRLTGAVLIGTALQLAVIYWPPAQGFFHTVPLSPGDLVTALTASTIPFFAVEAEKWIRRDQARE